MSKPDTWMPLYVGDYLADTMRLTTLEHGAYFLLLMEYWRQGPLPDDDKALASITKLDRRTWDKEVGPVVRKFFEQKGDGFLYQKRADFERARTAELSETRRQAAMQRGARKKSNINNGGAPPNGELKHEQLQEQLLPQKQEQKREQLQDQKQVLEQTHARVTRTVARPSQSQKERVPTTSAVSESETPLPSDARARLWAVGPPAIQAMTGLPGKRCRALVGQLLKAVRDDCAALLAILDQAADVRPVDPVPWLQAAIRQRTHAKPGAMDALRERWDLPALQYANPPTDDETDQPRMLQ